MNKREFRFMAKAGLCSRAKSENAPIKGVSAVYFREGDPSTEYWLWNDMVEHIMPGAFDRALKDKHDVRALFNHDASQLLGRTSAGTVTLSLSDVGLEYEIPFDPSDPDHLRVASKLDRGDVTGSSFAFVATRTSWIEEKTDQGYVYIRQIEDVDLYDVGPVTYPAYEGTTAGRSARAKNWLPNLRGPEQDKTWLDELRAERDRFLGDDVAVRMAVMRARC